MNMLADLAAALAWKTDPNAPACGCVTCMEDEPDEGTPEWDVWNTASHAEWESLKARKLHAWSAEDAHLARTGHYNSHEGRGWKKCTDSIPVDATDARDKAAREEQRQHRAEVMHRIHDTGEALIAYAEAPGG